MLGGLSWYSRWTSRVCSDDSGGFLNIASERVKQMAYSFVMLYRRTLLLWDNPGGLPNPPGFVLNFQGNKTKSLAGSTYFSACREARGPDIYRLNSTCNIAYTAA